MSMAAFLRTGLDALVLERGALTAEVDAIVAKAKDEQRSNLTPEETADLDKRSDAIKAKDAEIDEQRKRVAAAEEREQRSAAEAETRKETGSTGAGAEARVK